MVNHTILSIVTIWESLAIIKMVVDRVYQIFCECETWKEGVGKEKMNKSKKYC